MDATIISLAGEKDQQGLYEVLQKLTRDEIEKMLDNRIIEEKDDPVVLVRALLFGYYFKEEERAEKWLHVYQHCVKCIQKQQNQSDTKLNLIDFLMWQVEKLPNQCLVSLAKYFVETIKTGQIQNDKILELFPKLLSVFSSQEKVQVDHISWLKGSDYKSQILNSICSCRWETCIIIRLVDMFRDVPMSSEELEFVIDKTIRLLPELDLCDLPALTLNLLLLSVKGHKLKVLEGIMDFFIERDSTVRKQTRESESMDVAVESVDKATLRSTEGTVILHIIYAVKHDNDLVKEFIRFLKMQIKSPSNKVCTPFVLAMALCVGQVFRFKDQIFTLLRNIILKTFQDAERQSQNALLQFLEASVPEDLILETVENSAYGWDNVIQGLVRLGFVLMDSFGPKGSFGRVEGITLIQPVTHQRACHLGSQILAKAFKAHHDVVRENILNEIFTRIGTSESQPIKHFLDLLSQVVKSGPQLLLNSVKKLAEMFDHLPSLPPSTATSLLEILQPILKFSITLRDALMLLLRKSMFSKHLNFRKVSAKGYLMILKHFKIIGSLPSSQSSQTFSLSQLQVDVQSRVNYNPVSNSTLCLEVIRNLRRCLSQQADVRFILYSGLYSVLNKNSKLQEPILDLLLNQFKKYYEAAEDVNPPIQLQKCLINQGSQVYLGEPLAHLLCCIVQCSLRGRSIHNEQDESDEENEEVDTSSLNELEKILASITQRMIKSELEDFELDKSADFSTKNSVGVKNTIISLLLLGIYESLMEYTFFSGNFSETSCEQIQQLFNNHQKLTTILKSKIKTPSTKAGTSLFSLHFTTEILHALFIDTSHESLEDLKQNTDFICCILGVALQKVTFLRDRGTCDGADLSEKDKLMAYSCKLGRFCLKYYQRIGPNSDKKEKKAVSTLCLEILNVVTQLIYANTMSVTIPLTDKQEKWLIMLLQDTEVSTSQFTGLQQVTEKHVKIFQRIATNILSSTNDNRNMTELGLLLEIITVYCNHLSPGQVYNSVLQWVQNVCEDEKIEHIAVCKLLLSLLLKMTRKIGSTMNLVKEMCRDIHSQLDDIDKELEVEDSSHYGLISSTTSCAVLTILLSHISSELDEASWVIEHIKGELQSPKDVDINASLHLPTQQTTILQSLSTVFASLVAGFHELAQTALPNWSIVELLLKQLTNFYNTVSGFIKYFLQMYLLKAGHLDQRVEKLVKLIALSLTPQVYMFLTYIQHEIKEPVKAPKKDKKSVPNSSRTKTASIKKQVKVIPKLIFAIETFEKYLMQLSQKSKINLMEHVKPSVARDFRINGAVVRAALEEQGASASSDSEEEEENNDPQNEKENEDEEVEADEEEDAASEDEELPAAKKTKYEKKTKSKSTKKK